MMPAIIIMPILSMIIGFVVNVSHRYGSVWTATAPTK